MEKRLEDMTRDEQISYWRRGCTYWEQQIDSFNAGWEFEHVGALDDDPLERLADMETNLGHCQQQLEALCNA